MDIVAIFLKFDIYCHRKLKERSNFQYSDQEEEIFKTMSKDQRIGEKIFRSIAPGIYGNE